MSLSDVLDIVSSDLAERNVTAQVAIGKDWTDQETNVRLGRIAAVPGRLMYAAALEPGGNPRCLATRWQEIEFHVWNCAAEQADAIQQQAADHDACAALCDALVGSMVRMISVPTMTFPEFVPNDKTRTLSYGVEMVGRCRIAMPVRDVSWPETPIDYSDHVDKARLPDGDHTANPSL